MREADVAHDPDDTMERLIEAAEAALAAAMKADAARAKVREKRAEAARAEGRLKTAEDAEARWREDWRQACADTWLEQGAALPTVGAMRQTLKALDELRAGLKDCADLGHRIEAMERDRADLRRGGDGGRRGAGARRRRGCCEARRSIAARVASAREARRRREEKEKALAAARDKHAGIIEALAVNERLAAAMTGRFAVPSRPKSSASSTTASVASRLPAK